MAQATGHPTSRRRKTAGLAGVVGEAEALAQANAGLAAVAAEAAPVIAKHLKAQPLRLRRHPMTVKRHRLKHPRQTEWAANSHEAVHGADRSVAESVQSAGLSDPTVRLAVKSPLLLNVTRRLNSSYLRLSTTSWPPWVSLPRPTCEMTRKKARSSSRSRATMQVS